MYFLQNHPGEVRSLQYLNTSRKFSSHLNLSLSAQMMSYKSDLTMLRQKPWVWGKLGLKNILASRTSSAFPFLGLRPKCSKQNVYIQRDIYAFIHLSFSNKENTTHSPGYFLLWTPLVLPCQVLRPTSCQSRKLSKSWHTQKSNVSQQ